MAGFIAVAQIYHCHFKLERRLGWKSGPLPGTTAAAMAVPVSGNVCQPLSLGSNSASRDKYKFYFIILAGQSPR